MNDRRVNKEWLSLHQCIDEFCPVHASHNTSTVTGDSNLSKARITNQKPEYMHDSLTTNKFNQHHGNLKQFAEVDDKQSKHGDENNGVSVDLSDRSEALKSISRCYEDRTVTYSPSNSLKTLMQKYGDDVGETLNTIVGINGNDLVCKGKASIAKPRFMCTWLDKHADINNYPFYKLAVYYGSRSRVRKDAAVYSSFVTSQIWTSHKYGGGSEEDADCNSETTSSTRASGSKPSRSHENLSQSIDSILKDIPDVDISDLKLKYGFLFNPNYIFRKSDKNNPGGGEQNELFDKQKSCQYSNNNGGVVNNDGPFNEAYFVHAVREENYSEGSVNQYFNGRFAPENDKNKPNQVQQSALSIKNKCNELNSILLAETDQEKDFINWGSHSTGNVGVNTCVGSPYLSRTPPVREKNTDPRHTSHDDCMNNQHKTTVFCDNFGRWASPYTTIYKNNDVSVSPSTSAAYYVETSGSHYLPESYVRNSSITGNSLHQTPSIPSPYNSYYTGSPHHGSALNKSPLVSMPAIVRYVSPVVHVDTPKSTDHSLHYLTKRSKDPRLQASGFKNTCDRLRRDERTEVHHTVHTPSMSNFIDSPTYSSYDENHMAYLDGHSRHGVNMRTRERQRTGSKERRHHYQPYTDNEDPLNGLADPVNIIRQRSPENHIESPNSDIFYRINGNQNKEEQHVDDVMNLFYADNCSHQKYAASISDSPFVVRHRSSSTGRSRSRSLRYLRDVIPRARSRSRETTVSISRRYKSHKFRRSRSSSAGINRRHDSRHSRHPGPPGNNRKYWRSREKYISKADTKRNSYSTYYKRNSEKQHSQYKDHKPAMRRESHTYDYERKKRRISTSPDSRSSGITKARKREKTTVSSPSARSSKSEINKTIDSRRYYDRKRIKSSHKRNEDTTRRNRCARRR